ncbi:MAG: amidase, partial [Betaproteobacteria bacterium HGW-Betaproteobacteria-18]
MTDTQKQAHEQGVTELAGHFKRGSLSLKDYALAMLAYTQAVEPEVKAFAHHDANIVAMQTERLSALSSAGAPLPELFGVPIAIKDNIDTCDYPTEFGYAPASGRTPGVDAYLVHKLRQAGALVWAKSRTTELAYLQPTITANPRAPGHTPGGSSSGSAAAVAAGLVPAAIGTQTNGSVIRPASFCGVYGFKPSRGLIFNGGVLKCAPSLDQVGVFARSVEDVAAVAEVLVGGHQQESGQLIFPMQLKSICKEDPPLPPKFMFVKTPMWERVDPAAREAFEALADELKDCMVEVALPQSVANALAWHKTVMEAEMVGSLQGLVAENGGQASAPMLEALARGAQVLAADYLVAHERMRAAA